MKQSKEDLEKLWDMIKDVEVCMMVTADPHGHLRSRPMDTQKAEFDGDLWFFAKGSSPKTDEIKQDSQVNLSYMDKGSQKYISVSGKASIIDDREKAKEMWNSMLKAYFPDGLEDPDLRLIKISVIHAEYWDAPSNIMVHLFEVVKSAVTGKEYDAGENKKVNVQ